KIDIKLANECLEEIENSDYIEFALHGLLHGNYDKNGRQINELEYFNTNTENNVSSCKTEEEINRTFDIFYEIYNSWGFTKKIRSFSEPGEPPKYICKNEVIPLAKALADRGIKYWTNYWIKDTLYFDSVLYMAKTSNLVPPWNAYDLDPTYLRDFTLPTDEKEYTILGLHWPNFLKFHPENNLSVVPLWKEYFRRQSEIFGLMVSKDIAFAGNQHVYRQLSKIEENDGFLSVDVADVYSQPSVEPYGYFYLSIRNEFAPISSEGCVFELYEKHNEFKTYKITHNAKQMKITLK
ncbi:MAG: hypothetical protein IKU45_04435, partial [Clostridia bacterium]|nr:hypothetical protein [Clostridia bacterium]